MNIKKLLTHEGYDDCQIVAIIIASIFLKTSLYESSIILNWEQMVLCPDPAMRISDIESMFSCIGIANMPPHSPKNNTKILRFETNAVF